MKRFEICFPCYALVLVSLLDSAAGALYQNSSIPSKPLVAIADSGSIHPLEIYTTIRNEFAGHPLTARPPFIFDDEPTSCYPDWEVKQSLEWWRGQTINDNPCYTLKENGCKDWHNVPGDRHCFIQAGDVRLIYFAEQEDIPDPVTTFYDPGYEFTFTSPSVYVVFSTIRAWIGCPAIVTGSPKYTQGGLGPSLTNVFYPFDIGDISTLVPHTPGQTGTVFSTSQLHLSDLKSGCSTVPFNQTSAWMNTMPVAGDEGYRCYPRIDVPRVIKKIGSPWWSECRIFDWAEGIIDPPYVLTPAAGLVPFPVATTTSLVIDMEPSMIAPLPGSGLTSPGPTPTDIPSEPDTIPASQNAEPVNSFPDTTTPKKTSGNIPTIVHPSVENDPSPTNIPLINDSPLPNPTPDSSSYLHIPPSISTIIIAGIEMTTTIQINPTSISTTRPSSPPNPNTADTSWNIGSIIYQFLNGEPSAAFQTNIPSSVSDSGSVPSSSLDPSVVQFTGDAGKFRISASWYAVALWWLLIFGFVA